MKIKHVLGVSLFSLVLGFNFVSCNDDDDNNNPPQAPSEIVGIWKYSGVQSVVETTDPETKEAIIEYIENQPNKGVSTYNLKIDKTYELRIAGAEKDSTGNYIYNNGKITFDNKKEVIEALQLDESKVTKADAVRIYKRFSK